MCKFNLLYYSILRIVVVVVVVVVVVAVEVAVILAAGYCNSIKNH